MDTINFLLYIASVINILTQRKTSIWLHCFFLQTATKEKQQHQIDFHVYSFYLFPINFFSFYLFYYKDISKEANIIHVHTLIGLVNYHGLYSFLKTYKKINEMQCPFKQESYVYIFFVPMSISIRENNFLNFETII